MFEKRCQQPLFSGKKCSKTSVLETPLIINYHSNKNSHCDLVQLSGTLTPIGLSSRLRLRSSEEEETFWSSTSASTSFIFLVLLGRFLSFLFRGWVMMNNNQEETQQNKERESSSLEIKWASSWNILGCFNVLGNEISFNGNLSFFVGFWTLSYFNNFELLQ